MSGGVDSASRSVVVELKSAPGSELETADPLDHLHKIGQGIPSTEDSIQSSTSIQGRWESVPGTWHESRVK